MTSAFNQLNLHPLLVQAVSELGYTSPTPIQSEIIPVMLTGRDVIGQAQTGTGKTAAFALPLLQNLEPDQNYVQCLILAPTRELALQVSNAVYEYGKLMGTRVLAVYGGQPYGRQINRLQRGVDVVVGTPGRLLDLIEKKALDLSRVRAVVLDEADEMLSMGFIEDIEAILTETPAMRQTALFSATLPAAIRRLAQQYMRDPKAISIQPEQVTVSSIEQRYYLVNEQDKLSGLARLFEVEDISSALIFARTRVGTGELANELSGRGFPAEALNGDLSQDLREQILNRFRRGLTKVLVATDVAARGLDIEDISHVFNYDLPEDPELYVHRIGRTGRAGKAGIAITLATPAEQWRLRRIESFSRQKLERRELPTIEEIHQQREAKLTRQVTIWLQRGRCQREREMVAALVESGYDAQEIAAAALKIARADESQRPIPQISPVQERQARKSRAGSRSDLQRKPAKPGRQRSTSHEAGMVRLSLSKGKAHGIRTSDVVSSIAYFADIPGHTIGKIFINDRETLVDVPEQLVSKVLAKTSSYRIRKQSVKIELAQPDR